MLAARVLPLYLLPAVSTDRLSPDPSRLVLLTGLLVIFYHFILLPLRSPLDIISGLVLSSRFAPLSIALVPQSVHKGRHVYEATNGARS